MLGVTDAFLGLALGLIALLPPTAARMVAPPPPLPPLPPGPAPVPAPEPVKALRFDWHFVRDPGASVVQPKPYAIEVAASAARFEDLAARDHGVRAMSDYARFVTGGLTPEVDEAARRLREFSQRDGLGRLEEMNNLLAFVQSIPYAKDDEAFGVPERPLYPLEFMWHGRGDCEDHAILAGACLMRLGYEVKLVQVDYGTSSGHMALAVAGADELPQGFFVTDARGRRYFYCEATFWAGEDARGVQMRVGEIPERDRSARLTLIDLV